MKPLKAPAIYLEGYVGEDITDAKVRAFLNAASGHPVNVYINSPGGDAFEGIAIHNTLKAHSSVTAIVNGIAASAASLIAMAGKEIIMLAGSMMMIHNPAGITIGPSSLHRKSADRLDKLGDQAAAMYATRTGQPKASVLALMEAETWMNGEEALEMGFADKAISDAADAPKMTMADATTFARTPEAIMKLVKLEAKEAKNMTTVTAPTASAAADPTSVRDSYKAIMAGCRAAGLALADAEMVVEKADGDPEKAKTIIIDMQADRHTDPAAPQINAIPAGNEKPGVVTLATTIGDALYARMSGKPATGEARNWSGASVLDMGAALLEARGEKIVSRNKDRLAAQITMSRGMNTTSDFPNIAANAGQRILLDAYQAAETPLKQIARNRNANDFRAISTIRLGEAPSLEEVPEGAEISYGSRAEAAESFKLKTFARIFALSRQAIVNDDLQAFGDMVQAWGRAAAEREATEIVSLFLANSGAGVTVSDNKALYHTDHGNKAGTAAAISVTSLAAGRQALRDTKGLDGKTPLALTPKFLVVGSEKETEAEQVLATLAAATVDDVNPFQGRLTLLVEPRLSGKSWRLFADPVQAPVIDIAYLNGAQGPQIETQDGWNTLGTEFRAVLDFGCGASGWRGTYLNTGA